MKIKHLYVLLVLMLLDRVNKTIFFDKVLKVVMFIIQ